MYRYSLLTVSCRRVMSELPLNISCSPWGIVSENFPLVGTAERVLIEKFEKSLHSKLAAMVKKIDTAVRELYSGRARGQLDPPLKGHQDIKRVDLLEIDKYLVANNIEQYLQHNLGYWFYNDLKDQGEINTIMRELYVDIKAFNTVVDEGIAELGGRYINGEILQQEHHSYSHEKRNKRRIHFHHVVRGAMIAGAAIGSLVTWQLKKAACNR